MPIDNPSVEEIEQAIEDHMGWCTVCKDFTTDSCEPDARKYQCEVCRDFTVYGAEEAILMGLF